MRRPPELLDVSSSPAKKRRTMGRNSIFGVDNRRGSSLRSVKEESEPELLTSGTWKTRLRSRRRVKSGDRVDLSRRRKLCGEMDEKASESGVGMEEGIKEEGLVVVNKKSPERLEEANALGDEVEANALGDEAEVNALGDEAEVNALGDEAEVSGEEEEMHETEDEVDTGGVEEECESGEELEVVRNEAEDVTTILERVIGGENEAEIVDNDAKEMLEEEEREVLSSKELEEDCIADKNVCIETVDQSIKEGEQLRGGDRGENQQDGGEDGGNSTNEV